MLRCLSEQWPPYLAKSDGKMEEGWATVKRKDGRLQSTYDGKPLYFYSGDNKKGDKTGDASAAFGISSANNRTSSERWFLAQGSAIHPSAARVPSVRFEPLDKIFRSPLLIDALGFIARVGCLLARV